MPGYDDGTPSLGEIARILSNLRDEITRNITDFRNEYRVGVSELVRKDVYAVKESAQDARIMELETRAKFMQNLLYGTLASAVLAVIGWVLTALAA